MWTGIWRMYSGDMHRGISLARHSPTSFAVVTLAWERGAPRGGRGFGTFRDYRREGYASHFFALAGQ
jgi:hypothetical protein